MEQSAKNYTEQYARHLEVERQQNVVRARYGRRRFLRGSAILALGGVAAAMPILAACGGDEEEVAPGAGTAASGGATTAPAGGTATTASGSGSGTGATGAASSPYPLVEQYNWRSLDWSAGPPKSGGIAERPIRPLANWDLRNIVVATPNPPFYNGLYRPRSEAGPTILSPESLNLDGQQFVPDLAQATEHNDDFTEWTFTIPSNVKFHDIAPVKGRTMTAEDVVFSFDLYRTDSLWADPLKVVERVEAVDDTTVTFKLTQPSFVLPNIVAMPYYAIFAREHFEGPSERWEQQPIGTGAFQLESSEPNVGFKAVRHPEYWETDSAGTQLPYLDGFNGTYYSDRNALLAAFRAGNIDETGLANTNELEQLVSDVKDAYYAVSPHWATYQNTLIPQWQNPLFVDDRVRKALSMAIDRKAIVDRLLDGGGTPAYPVPFDQMGLSQPLTWDDMPASMSYDATAAKQLLDAAGHGDGLKLELLTNTPVREEYVAIQQYWKDIGITLDFEEVDFLVYQTRIVQKDFKDLTFYNGLAGFDADVITRPLYYPGSAQNQGSVDLPEMTALLDKLYVATDADERIDLARQVNDIALSEVPRIPVNGYHTYIAAHNWLHTFAQSLYTTPDNWSSTIWRYFWLDENTPNGRGGSR